MARSVEALVKPDLLIWARNNAGLTVEQAAKKAQVKPERLESWETGERRPTIKQLRKLGNAYKRPLAVFYLPEPPKDFQPIRDFRSFPGIVAGVESPNLRFEIRQARDRREIALDLYEELEGELPQFSAEASLSDNPEKLAIQIRNRLGITREIQCGFKDEYNAFNWWRSAVEDAGVLVFQATGIDLSEMRGFSISETPLPAIVVNVKDLPRARVFTMLHEFVHIMLQDGGLCDLREEARRAPGDERIEVFCNRVAGAMLVPRDSLLQEDIVLQKGRGAEWSDEDILTLARRYQVSSEVLLRRLLICGRTTREFYQRKRREFEQQYEMLGRRIRSGHVPPYRVAISKAGPMFIRLVLSNYYQENITTSDLSDFLNIKLKHLHRIEGEILGQSTEFGAAS